MKEINVLTNIAKLAQKSIEKGTAFILMSVVPLIMPPVDDDERNASDWSSIKLA